MILLQLRDPFGKRRKFFALPQVTARWNPHSNILLGMQEMHMEFWLLSLFLLYCWYQLVTNQL